MSIIEKAAILGAAGAIGPQVGAELDRRGIPFRAVGRNRRRLEQAFAGTSRVEVFEADAGDPGSASEAIRGCDTVFYTLGLPYPEHQRHPMLMAASLKAAQSAQAKRLVLISSVYPYGVPRTARVSETHPRVP